MARKTSTRYIVHAQQKHPFHASSMATVTLLPLRAMFSVLCGSTVALYPQKHPLVGYIGPYRDPGIGGATFTPHCSVSAAHLVVDPSWKVGLTFTQPSWITEQALL